MTYSKEGLPGQLVGFEWKPVAVVILPRSLQSHIEFGREAEDLKVSVSDSINIVYRHYQL